MWVDVCGCGVICAWLWGGDPGAARSQRGVLIFAGLMTRRDGGVLMWVDVCGCGVICVLLCVAVCGCGVICVSVDLGASGIRFRCKFNIL